MRFCVFKLGAIGDILFTLPNAEILAKAADGSSITWIAQEDLAMIPSLSPSIDQVFIVDRSFFSATPIGRLRHAFRLRRRLPSRFDGILLLHRHWGYLLAIAGKGPIYRLSRPPKNKFVALMHKISSVIFNIHHVESPTMSIHESLAIRKATMTMLEDLNLRAPLIEKTPVPQLRSPPLRRDITLSNTILIHLGGGQNLKSEFLLKRWPFMRSLISELLRTRTEDIGIVGSPTEKTEALELIQSLSNPRRLKNYAGTTTLTQLITLISQSKLLVGPDSGPLHIADAMGTPCIGIYGPTSDISWGLIGPHSRTVKADIPCRPCYKDDGKFPICRHNHSCMQTLSTETVVNEIQALLQKTEIGLKSISF